MPLFATTKLVDLVHLASVRTLVIVLQVRKVVVGISLIVVVVGAQAKLDHPVDAVGEGLRLVERETGGEQRGLDK